MSTHSVICVVHNDKVESIYSHWDGYLSHNGVILQKYYDLDKTKELMKLGNISVLGAEIGNMHNFDNRETFKDLELDMQVANVCTAYSRDRHEVDQQSIIHASLQDMFNYYDEYHYYVIDTKGVWHYYTHNVHSLLADAIKEDAEIE